MIIRYSDVGRNAVHKKRENRLTCVYGLFDESNPEEILYVGATVDAHQRLYQHFNGGNIKTPLAERILDIRRKGGQVGIHVLHVFEAHTSRAAMNNMEEIFIRKINPPLNVALSAIGRKNSKDSNGKRLRAEVVELRKKVAELENLVADLLAN